MNSKRALFGFVLLLAAGLLFLSGCGKKTPGERAGELSVSKMIEKATGGKAEIDFKTGQMKIKTAEGDAVITGGGTWPGDLPEEFPQFRAGAIVSSSNSTTDQGKSWLVIFRDVEADAVAAYIEDLKNNGWNVQFTSDMPNGSVSQLSIENMIVQMTYFPEQKTMNLGIQVKKGD